MKLLSTLTFAALLQSAAIALAQTPVEPPVQPLPPLAQPAEIIVPVPSPVPALPAPEDLADPFNGTVGATGSRMTATYAKAVQTIKVVGLGRSRTGKAEAILRLPDKSVLYVRIGETFTFLFAAGLSLPCEVSAIEEQEVGLRVNNQIELRLR